MPVKADSIVISGSMPKIKKKHVRILSEFSFVSEVHLIKNNKLLKSSIILVGKAIIDYAKRLVYDFSLVFSIPNGLYGRLDVEKIELR